jgi:hypothetical protein
VVSLQVFIREEGMKLDSVLELREKARQIADAGGALGRISSVFGAVVGPLDVSLGVYFAGKGNFKLAVRMRHDTFRYRAFAARVRLMAFGEIDLRTTGPVNAIGGCVAGDRVTRPLAIGASIGHRDGSGGTVGFFARRRSDDEVGVVSNNHVLALADEGRANDVILHPSVCDGGTVTNNVVGRLDGNYPRLREPGRRRADCAFAVLNTPPSEPGRLGEDGTLKRTIAVPTEQLGVIKIGRTTGRRLGRIKASDFDRLQVHNYGFAAAVRFNDQIEIEAAEPRVFSTAGDSGSLVFTESNEPVGLLFSGTASGGPFGLGLYYATPMKTVLDALGVDLLV